MIKKERTTDKGIHTKYVLLPYVFLLASLMLTYTVWQSEKQTELGVHKSELEYHLKETAQHLKGKLTLFDHSLNAVKSLFKASEFVSEGEFVNFSDVILNSEFSSSLSEIGFIKLVNPSDAETFFSLDSKYRQSLIESPAQALQAPIIYSVSHVNNAPKSNTFFNVFEHEQLKQDMVRSAILDTAILTEKVKDNFGPTPNCISMVMPVYDKSFQKKNLANMSIKQDIYGWVYVNLNLQDALSTTFNKQHNSKIAYTLYKGTHAKKSDLVYKTPLDSEAYQSEHSQHQVINHLPIKAYGQEWVLYGHLLPHTHPLMGQESGLSVMHSSKIGLLGLLISFSVTGLLFLLISRMQTFFELKHVNKRLQFSDDRWRFALEGAGDGIWDWDLKSNQVTFSKRWGEILGFAEGELTDSIRKWESLLHPDDKSKVRSSLISTLKGFNQNFSIESRFQCKSGEYKWILTRGMVVSRDNKGHALRMVGTHTDITKSKESEHTIWTHANFDHLTGLPNRRMFYNNLEKALKKSKESDLKLALLFFDLDNFKEINDSLGHDQGDVLLLQAAQRLLEGINENVTVARLGGDEFIMLITGIDSDHQKLIDQAANKVLKALAEPFILNNEKAFVSTSMGIVVYPDNGESIDDLMKNVDQSMYASKEKGGNCFTYFTPQMQTDALNHLQLSNDLRNALSRKELFIEYQPIVELATGVIYKAEALLRWQHREKGLISPAEFIPIAESTRLINDIGYWVFMESIKQCMSWRTTVNSKFQIAVNKSPIQFTNPDAKYGKWIDTLSKLDNSEKAIVVEITEGLLLEASDQVGQQLDNYQNHNIEVALDDFGTGYSSLSYIKKFDIDYLKIDQSFVSNLEESSENKVLCSAIITMAHSLGIKVIAEGIETAEQQRILVEAECDFGQGYYFSKPLRPEKFEAYIKDRNQ